MKSLKAITLGLIFILLAALLMQRAYVFIDARLNLSEIKEIVRYLLAIPAFLIIMLIAGYITAALAKSKVLIHSFLVGVIAVGSMMWAALAHAELTNQGLFINLLLVLFTILGGFFWKRRHY